MSTYRTQSLFHYTKSSNNIISILEAKKLYPNYCKEDLSTEKHPDFVLGIPQICFCDIPLSMANVLVDNYGHYAIAFKKSWGLDNWCNPITYVNDDRIIDAAIHNMKRILELRRETREVEKAVLSGFINNMNVFIKELEDTRSRIYSLGFLKKYSGEWKKKTYCNYQENEWRYIIPDWDKDVKWMNEKEYDDWRGNVRKAKPQPSQGLKKKGLKFSINDIQHIVVKKENEITPFVKKLLQLKDAGKLKITDREMSLLLTKIISFERIAADF